MATPINSFYCSEIEDESVPGSTVIPVTGGRKIPSVVPAFTAHALRYTLLTQYHAVAHPSLPNYIAMIGGDTCSRNFA